MTLMQDLLHRLRISAVWIAAQFVGTLLIVLAVLGWTRLPDSHGWQVAFTILVPLLLLACLLALQAGTMRRLSGETVGRVRFFWGALSLLFWFAIVCLFWVILDWCNDQTVVWAGYLNSRASAGGRATVFTYDHLQSWITWVIWAIRWIAMPAKVIPWAMESARFGWRLRIGRIIRLLFNWRYWLAAIAAAVIAVVLPSHFFNGLPRGTVSHQVWAVAFKLAGAYLLAMTSWVLMLAWAAVLLARAERTTEQLIENTTGTSPVGPVQLETGSEDLTLPDAGNHVAGNS